MKHSTYTSYDELPLMLSVAEVVELPLTADEKATFHACCEGIRHNMEHLKEI